MSNKSWGGRFDESPDAAAVAFSTSVEVDKRLAREDIEGSIAHARMLGARGILDQADVAKIIAGLTQLQTEVQAGTVQWDRARRRSHELESVLTERIGDAGRACTPAAAGRSSGDGSGCGPSAPASTRLGGSIYCSACCSRCRTRSGLLLPGTRICSALRGAAGPHLLAWSESSSDRGRLLDAAKRMDLSPSARARSLRPPSARPRGRRQGARLRRRHSQLARRGRRPRLLGRSRRRARQLRGAHVALRRRAGVVEQPRVRLRPDERRVHDRLVDDASEEEPRHGRASARQKWTRGRRLGVAASDAQGLTADLQPRHARGQAADVGCVRHGQRLADGALGLPCFCALERKAHARRAARRLRQCDGDRGLSRDQGSRLPRRASRRRQARSRRARARQDALGAHARRDARRKRRVR